MSELAPSSPKVSIIVPVYNAERYIGRCIESVFNQTMKDWQLILVDDYSFDNSFAVMIKYADEDCRIQVVRHDQNHGPMIARRWGDRLAKGDYITYCDADDLLPPNALERLYRAAIESDADIVCGNHLYITTTGKKYEHHNVLKYGETTVDVLKSLLRHEVTQSLWGKLFKVSLLQNYDYKTYDHATNGEDGCIFYQVVTNINKMILIDDVVYHYMRNADSSSQRRYNDNAIKSICILNKTRDDTVSFYPKLYADLNRCITNILCGLYVQGYNKGNTYLSKHISENNLGHYISFSNLVRYLDYIQIIKLFILNRILKK